MDEKQNSSRLTSIRRWLEAVTEKNIMKGSVIVVLTGIFAAATAYSALSKIELPITELVGTIQTLSAVSAFVMTLLGWVLSSLIYHASAHLLGGSGSRNRMFALSGYASIPSLVQQFLRFITSWFLGPANTLANGGIFEIFLKFFNVFSVIGLIVVGLAVMINYRLTSRKAAIVVILPTLISLTLTLATRNIYGDSAANFQGF